MQQTVVSDDIFRAVMRRVASPVAVVTAAGAHEARGTTIGSFTCVSLRPPLISFNLERGRQMHGVLNEASRFAVHILCDGHSSVCNHFATPDRSGRDQLAAVPHRRDAWDTPILNDALAVIHCRPYATYEAGDHSIIIGEVASVEQHRQGRPLLYYDRSYRSIGRAI